MIYINKKIKSPTTRTNILAPLVALTIAILCVATYADTFKISNETVSNERLIREHALQAGLFDHLPDQYFLIFNAERWEQNPAFFRQFYDVPIKRVVSQRNYLGEPFSNPDYYFKIYFGPHASEGFPPDSIRSFSRNALNGKEMEFEFTPKDEVFYLDTLQIVSPTDGIALLSQPHFYRATSRTIKTVTATSALLYIQKPHTSDISGLDVEVKLRSTTRSSDVETLRIPTDKLPVVRSGPHWKIFRITSPKQDAELDLTSLQAIVQKKPSEEDRKPSSENLNGEFYPAIF